MPAADATFTPSLTPGGEELRPGTLSHSVLTIALMLATIIQVLDTTIANVALPHMQTSLGATYDTVTWVLTSYIVAAAVTIPTTGWLSARIGPRNLFLVAVTGFVIASMLCGIATSLTEMVVFRALQGVAGAFISPLSQSVMLNINPRERHGKAMSIWGMGVMVAPIIGPVLGGYLTEEVNWRWVFFVNVPIGGLCLFLLFALLPKDRQPERRFDKLGFGLLALGLASLQLLLDRGQTNDWFESTETLIEAGVAISALWMFGVHMVTGRNPLFSREILTNRNLLSSLALMSVISIALFANMALLPPMLQNLFNYDVIDTGLLLAPRGIGILITMWLSGILLGRVDARILIASGLSMIALSLWQMTHWTLVMDWRPFFVSGIVQGLGMGFVFVPLNTLAFGTLPPDGRTDGASLLNLVRSLGGSVGISIVVTYLSRGSQTSHEMLAQHVTDQSLGMAGGGRLQELGSLTDSALSAANAEVTRQAMMVAYLDDFHLMMWITLLSIPFVLLLKRPPAFSAPPQMAME
ncbi:MDR family MFS transporter [Pacificimonas flava]|uniref:Inner membrane component of tripartite multidrug resistance system n=1 Tax=Pacificimonas flava TaxID=1234595 RepID=M2U5Y4_9SPHN|nr:MDR family MFS transporter [Pacificimonas flava]EMD83432.1 Inner membrane component of tripartite multidrug resistance system [Pacificimonas flava]MBB5279007.1 DHA2 family multidrug resistance protein [Pacificimonas flava]